MDSGQATRGAPADVSPSSGCALNWGACQHDAASDRASKNSGQPSGVEVPARCDGVPADRACGGERDTASSDIRGTASSGVRGGSNSSLASRDTEPTDRPPDDFLGAGFAAGSNFSPERDVLLRLVRSTAPGTKESRFIHVLQSFLGPVFWACFSELHCVAL